MKTYTYDVGSEPFDKWMAAHADCENLVLKGCLFIKDNDDELAPFNKVICGAHLRRIDIKDFYINELPDGLDDDNEICDFCENEKDGPGWWLWWQDEKGILQRMVVNREYGTSFIFEGNMVLSDDRKVIVCHTKPSEIVIPGTVEIIGKYAFYDAYINRIVIPQSVTLIDVAAFCDGLVHGLCIPNSVKRIASWSFCRVVESVVIPEGVEVIEDYAFTGIKHITLPSTLKEIGKFFFQDEDDCCEKIPRVDVADNNPYFYSENGTLYSRSEKVPYLGKMYLEPVPTQLLIWPKPENFVHEYTVEEILADYPPKNICPINSQKHCFGLMYMNLDIILLIGIKTSILTKI